MIKKLLKKIREIQEIEIPPYTPRLSKYTWKTINVIYAVCSPKRTVKKESYTLKMYNHKALHYNTKREIAEIWGVKSRHIKIKEILKG